ncbi:hypothetical protein [Pseudoalteromonas tunicata]|uniref:hypothetical protein n=1 Tax=Pseudoalteromonas tunicata TaxID=314281 RepID=UPI0013C31E19|nr:hypothetical protein [Pseudoalteromonas tunicata]
MDARGDHVINASLISLLRLACVLFLYSYSSCCRLWRGEGHYPYCVLAGLSRSADTNAVHAVVATRASARRLARWLNPQQ